MTLATTHSSNGPYDTGGGVTNFSYTFRTDDEADLVVYQYDTSALTYSTLVLNSDYTVTGVGGDSGGNVVIAPALASGYTVTILRVVDTSQTFNAPQAGAWSPAAYEAALDGLEMQIQQHDEVLVRCIKDAPWADPAVTDPASYLSSILAAAAAAPLLATNSVATAHIQNNAVDKDKISTSDISGDGLENDGTGAIRVDINGGTLARSSSGIKVADGGVNTTQIADLAVTAAKLDNNVVGGGLTKSGDALTVIFADQAAQELGTFTGSAVSPGAQHFHDSAVKAWLSFGGAAIEIKADYNIASSVNNAAGDYTFAFTNNMSSGEFSIATDLVLNEANAAIGAVRALNLSAAGFDLHCWQTHSIVLAPLNPAVLFDPHRVRVIICGDL